MPASPNHDVEKPVTLLPSSQTLPLSGKVSLSIDSLPIQEKEAFQRANATLHGGSDDDVVFLNGEPVVTTGRDVSRFVVDIRDDGDDALTFRSFVLGTVMAGLGAALCQV
jgi:hypothetical protein